MFDTVKIISPLLDDKTVEKYQEFCIKRTGIEIQTGELIYEFTSGQLKGSFDHRIGIKVRDKRVIIECSVHKAICGQNVFGGPDNLYDAVDWLIRRVQGLVGEELPETGLWQLVRVDVAYTFYLGSLDAVLQWFRDNTKAFYPRRKCSQYHGGLYFAGQASTLKFYSKGLEFAKRDFKRLKGVLDDEFLMKLTEVAYGILRVEVELKNKKLKYMFKKSEVLMSDVMGKESMFEEVYNEEVLKVSRKDLMVGNVMSVVRDYEKVTARLKSCYSDRLARTLLATWFRLSADGYDVVKTGMGRATFYRHVKQLREAGISWEGSDVVVGSGNRLVPDDFVPVSTDERVIIGTFQMPEFLVA